MKQFFNWAWAHVLLAFPIILVIALLKFAMKHNTFLAGYVNDF